ncbi:MAG TPA: acyl-CoA synthetase FdrA, partial [Chloroflexota bacterium]|nr:acyl-CoA synthetase FdrA [Chloroflexota bacterium]
GALRTAIREAQNIAAAAGRTLAFVASVCGTEADPQGLGSQESALRDAGAWIAPSNAAAVRWTLAMLGETKNDD